MKAILRLAIIIFTVTISSCQQKNNIQEKRTQTHNSNKTNSETKTDDCIPRGGELEILLSHFLLSEKPDNYLVFLSKKELRMMRNSIFASKGYIFKSKDLQDYFSSTNGYCPKYDNVDSLITETERENIKIIQKAEKTDTIVQDIDKYNYFINLFEKDKYGFNQSIPFYFVKYYLNIYEHLSFCFAAHEIINQTENYTVFVYSEHDCFSDEPDHYKICSIDNKYKEINTYDIDNNYEIIAENKIRCVFYEGVDYDGSSESYTSYDTVRIAQYLISDKGKITVYDE